MKLQSGLKAWMLSAAAGALLGSPISAAAQNSPAPAVSQSTAPQPSPRSSRPGLLNKLFGGAPSQQAPSQPPVPPGYGAPRSEASAPAPPTPQAPVQQTQAAAQGATEPAQQSEIMQRLAELYARDGREMPDMPGVKEAPAGDKSTAEAEAAPAVPQSPAAPVAEAAPAPVAAPVQVPAATAAPVAPRVNPLTAFFRRLMPGSWMASRSRPAPAPAATLGQPSGVAARPMPPVGPAAAVAEGQAADRPGLLADIVREESGWTARPQAAPMPSDEVLAQQNAPANAEYPANQAPSELSFDELADAFPEVSETEADGDTPFSGLTLDEGWADAAPLQPTPGAKTESEGSEIAQAEQAEAAEMSEEESRKLQLIAERGDLKGFKGFCPVTLRDDRELIDASEEHWSIFNAQIYHFATAEAKATFDGDPVRYAPAASGSDIVLLSEARQNNKGSLDFAVWYKDRLYLFSSQENLDRFVGEPNRFAR